MIDEALDGLDRFLWAALDIVFDEFDGIHAIAQLDGAGLVHVFSPQNVVGVHCKTGASSVGAALGESKSDPRCLRRLARHDGPCRCDDWTRDRGSRWGR